MNSRLRFILLGSVFLLVVKTCFQASAQTNAGAGDSLPPGRLYGEAALLTNYIENGVTQTDKSFALQAGLGYKWTQFRMGLWGTNTKYPSSDDNLNLRLYGAYKFIFTNNADLNVRYDMNNYYTSGDRNGSLVSLDLNLFKYHFLMNQNDKWEGVGQSTRWGFSKDWDIPWNFLLNVNAGYNMISAKSFSNYFDVKTTVNYKYADITYTLGNSYNSGSSQFDGRADIMFFLGLAAQF